MVNAVYWTDGTTATVRSVYSQTTSSASIFVGANALTTFSETMTMTPLFYPNLLYYHQIPQTTLTQSSLALPGQGGIAWQVVGQNYVTPSHANWAHVPDPGAAEMARAIAAERAARRLANAQKVVERSIALFRRFRPASEVAAFNAGSEIIIPGRRFNYRVSKSGDALSQAMHLDRYHVPYNLFIFTKDGRRLAKGCILAVETPLFDQLLALMFHANDNDEELKLIHETNWDPRLPREILQLAA